MARAERLSVEKIVRQAGLSTPTGIGFGMNWGYVMEGLWQLGPHLIWALLALYLVGCRFKPEIGRMIDRIRKIGPTGAEMEARSQEGLPPPEKPAQISRPQPPASDPITQEGIETIDREMQKLGLSTSEEREADLKLRLVRIALALTHEQTYQVIYGSQLTLLQDLNSVGTMPVSSAELIFNNAKSSYPELHANRSFDDWLRFLESRHLITRTGEVISATNYTRDFLTYLAQRGLLIRKWG